MAAQTSASQPGPKLKEQSDKGYERIIWEILIRSGYFSIENSWTWTHNTESVEICKIDRHVYSLH